MRQIILDTETTGLKPELGNRVIEIGCVELLNRKLTGAYRHFYINPQRESEPEALQVHGLTSEFLSDKPLFAAIVDDLLTFIKDSELVIHNAPFDCGFLNHELAQLALLPLESHVISVLDTWVLAKRIFPGKRNSLDALCQRFEIDNSIRTFHGALLDAQLLAAVYVSMTRGQESLLADDGLHLGASHTSKSLIDLTSFHPPIIVPSDQELSDHEAVLCQIDKSSNGHTMWRSILNKN